MDLELVSRQPLPTRDQLRLTYGTAFRASAVGLAFGTGSVFMALSQGSGELIWWPYLVGKYGLAFIFFLLPSCLLQYPVTFGICRYSILTGESIFRGFYRFSRPLTFILWILFSFSFIWFGAYATAGATALVELLPDPFPDPKRNVYLWALVSVAIYFSLLFIGGGVYKKIEFIMKIVAVVTLFGLLGALCQSQVRAQLSHVLKASLVPAGWPKGWSQPDAPQLLTAIMFAGLGGFWSLFNSYWILSKKAGLASRNRDEFTFDNGALPEETQETLSFWNRFSHLHVGIGVFGNYITTLLMCILAFTFLTPTGDVPSGWKLAVVQSSFFSQIPGGPTVFLIVAALFLIDTWVTTLDAVSKVQVDMIHAYFPKTSAAMTAKTMYYLVAIAIFILTCATMFLSQPAGLLLINGVVSAASMPILILLVFCSNFVVLKAIKGDKQTWAKVLLLFTAVVYSGLFVAYIFLNG